jgi:hypothetical protein
MFIHAGRYYFMWSEGGWTGPNYSVAYAISDSPLGPFKRIGKILQQDPSVATGAGHHSVIKVPGTDQYYIVYHRRPLGETDGNHRVVCIDHMEFDEQGHMKMGRPTANPSWSLLLTIQCHVPPMLTKTAYWMEMVQVPSKKAEEDAQGDQSCKT